MSIRPAEAETLDESLRAPSVYIHDRIKYYASQDRVFDNLYVAKQLDTRPTLHLLPRQ